jgi:peptidoglycan/xylan/chitin deacetylase (PgdA/CDA1 family)
MAIASSAILTYHSIDASGSPISVSPAMFRLHMAMLAEAKIPIVPLDQLCTTPGSVAITFDDGFRNFTEHALPVLRNHGYPATVFVVSGYCGKRNDWPSQPSGIPVLDLMDWAELRDIVPHGISLGGHSATHARLTGVSEDQLRREVFDSRARIEDRTGVSLIAFSYPYGDVDGYVRRHVARSYRIACGTSLRYLEPGDDMRDLPRLDAYYLQNGLAMRKLLSPGTRAYVRARGWIRTARTAVAG